MAIVIDKKLIPAIMQKARSCGLIDSGSSSMVAVYQISRYWRELYQRATWYKSDEFDRWNEKEVACARIIISTLLFLSMEKCDNIEQLLMDIVFNNKKSGKLSEDNDP